MSSSQHQKSSSSSSLNVPKTVVTSADGDEVVTVSALSDLALESGPRVGSRRKSREMWARTTSTGSFVMTNPLALLDKSGELSAPLEIDPEEGETFKKLSLEDQIRSLLVKSKSELSLVGSDYRLSVVRQDDESDSFSLMESEALKGDGSSLGSRENLHAPASVSFQNYVATEAAGSTPSSVAENKATLRASAVKNYKKLLAAESAAPPPSFNGELQSGPRATVLSRSDDSSKRLSLMPGASSKVVRGFRNSADEQALEAVVRTKENGKAVVASGTVTALVGVFMGVEEVELEYLQEFLFTHRFFMKSSALFDKMATQYWNATPRLSDTATVEDTDEWVRFRRLRVINFLRKWLQYHPGDFAKGDPMEASLQKFISENVNREQEGKYIQSLRTIVEKGLRPGMIPRTASQMALDTKLDSKERMKLNSFSFVQFKPESMAEQLTLLEWQLFADIKEKEFFDQIADSDENAGERLITMAKWIEKMHLWVATEVCMATSFKDRVSVIKR